MCVCVCIYVCVCILIYDNITFRTILNGYDAPYCLKCHPTIVMI